MAAKNTMSPADACFKEVLANPDQPAEGMLNYRLTHFGEAVMEDPQNDFVIRFPSKFSRSLSSKHCQECPTQI